MTLPRGEKIPPLRLIVAQGDNRAFEMVLPRGIGGHPVLDPAANSFGVEFQDPLLRDDARPRRQSYRGQAQPGLRRVQGSQNDSAGTVAVLN